MNRLWTWSISVWIDHDVFLSLLISFHGYEFYQNYYHSIMYKLCTGYDNDYWIMYFIGIMDNYGQIMGIIDQTHDPPLDLVRR